MIPTHIFFTYFLFTIDIVHCGKLGIKESGKEEHYRGTSDKCSDLSKLIYIVKLFQKILKNITMITLMTFYRTATNMPQS